MKNKLIVLFVSLLPIGAMAQSIAEALLFSQYNFASGTARTTAMAGAFTSLGSDISSMTINPAGLGMYNRSEMVITPGVNISKNISQISGASNYINQETYATLPNFGVAFKMGDITIGVGLNRLADFHDTQYFYGPQQGGSIGQMYADQLNGINEKTLRTNYDGDYTAFFGNSPLFWGAIMGFQSLLIDPETDDTYYMGGMFFPGVDSQTPLTKIETTGALNEISTSIAYNYKDKLYLGFTLGVQSLNYSNYYTYSEIMTEEGRQGSLNNFTTTQNLDIEGSGVNLKIGAIVRPLDWLRIGASYHSPTWLNIRESSYNSMTVYDFNEPAPGESDTPFLDNDYRLNTPSRLLTGISFTALKRVIFSFDYERTWYGGMNTKDINLSGYRPTNQPTIIDNNPTIADYSDPIMGNIDYRAMYQANLQATNNYRMGIEAQPINQFFLRAGYAYNQSAFSPDIMNYYTTDMLKSFGVNSKKELQKYGSSYQITGGLGYRSRIFGIDFAYVYGNYSSLPTKNYFYKTGLKETLSSQGYTTNTKELHQIAITISFRL